MKFRSLITACSFVLVMVLLSSCGVGDDSGKASPFKEVTSSTLGPSHGKPPVPTSGFDGKTISLGIITPLSGLAGFLGQAITNGSQTYWDTKNTGGGVAGLYKVSLEKVDTGANGTYDKSLSLQAYKKLAPNVVAFQQVLGTDVVLALKDKQIRDNKIIIPATLSGEFVRSPLDIPITNTYQTQAINGVGYFAGHTQIKNPKVCSLALDDSFGDDGVSGTTFAAKKNKLNYASKQQFVSGSPVSTQVDAIVKSQCNAVVVAGTAVDAASILGAFSQKKSDITIIGLTPFWIPEVNYQLTPSAKTYASQHLWISSGGAKWGDASVTGMAKMLSDIDAQSPEQKSNPFFMFGYVQAWAMDQLLEVAVTNGDLSSAGVARSLANVGTFDFGGLLPSYTYGPSSMTRKVPTQNTIFKYTSNDVSLLSPVADDSINYASKYASQYEYK